MARSLLVLACALGAWLTLAGVPAGAAIVHDYEGSFNGSERPALGAFSYNLPAVAVDQSNGDVWVSESKFFGAYGKAYAVDKFNAKGEYAGVQITGEATPQKEFAFNAAIAPGIAVDNTAAGAHKGDLYVADTGNGVVDRFSDSGAFECQITGRTPVTTEEREHECDGTTGSLTPQGSMEPAGVTVDSTGEIYVADNAHAVIDIFAPSGEYKEQIASPHLASMASIAVDSAGNLYVTNFNENVVEFDATGHFVRVLNEGDSPAGVAIDPANSHVYVGIIREENEEPKGSIAEYEPSGVLADVFGSMQFTFFQFSFSGMAVGPTGRLYAAEVFTASGAVVQIYGPDSVTPDVTTQAATDVEEVSATLHGHIDPDAAQGGGEVTKCQFEYGQSKFYGEVAACAPAPPYSAGQDVSAVVSGLHPASTYHIRLEAANGDGVASYGEDETLTTKGAPTVDEQAVEALMTSARIKVKIDPWGYETTCQLQYVPQASFQQSKWTGATTVSCDPEDFGSGFGDVTAKFTITGLARETVYDYRVLAQNQEGLSGHPDGTFETFAIQKATIESLKSSHTTLGVGWEPGELETQAGGRPYEVASTLEFSPTTVFSAGLNVQTNRFDELEFLNVTAPNVKNIHVDLPPGLIGNPTSIPECTRYLVEANACPPDTQVGIIELWVDGKKFGDPTKESENLYVQPRGSVEPVYTEAIYNLEPAGNYPAEFGAFIEGQVGAWIPFHVRTGSDYGVTADSLDISSTGGPIWRVRTRVWGAPADSAHDAERSCHDNQSSCPSGQPVKPLLTNPTSCVGPQTETVMADTWQEEGAYVKTTAEVPGFTGCGKLAFEPTLEAQPSSTVADSPSGLRVDLHMPQPEGCKEENGETDCELAEADLKDTKIVLPAGVTIDPSSADGLQACSEAQIGYLPGKSAEVGHPQFTPEAAQCPDASKIGSVEVDSPLVNHPLRGAVYVAQQDANPFRSLLALYFTVYDPQTGVVLKLAGEVSLDPSTGQLTTTVDEDPQLPFGDFKVSLFSGSRASLTTPFVCGSYATTAGLTPWSAPEGEDATQESPFQITGMPGGGACVDGEAQAPNGPSFEAGTASPVGGAYSPFVLKLEREDGSQHFSDLNVTLPPGLSGKIAGIEQCPQASIEAAMARGHEGEGALELAHPSCPSGSEVGVVHVGAGSGAPYYVTGHAYFAGPYKGAPFSLVIVTPAVAGPFDLGTVVVRAALFIDPNTTQVTVKSDPFPTILDGVPLDIRDIDVEVNRREFTLNPTSCEAMSVTGQEASTAGQVASLSDRFQAGGCTTLPFHPTFEVSTSGKTSRTQGASLTVHVGSSMGQANIAKVNVKLPKQLPSRLETLKGACQESVFAANPAACPAASIVGTALAHTPLLSSPLSGPVYIVSHGGAAFPDLEVVLNGEGVTIVLDGKTNIQNGITESSFETVPDAPVSSFEMSLPEGPHSILGAPGGGLCSLAAGTVLVKKDVTVKVKRHGHVQERRVTRTIKKTIAAGLLMPTRIQGQNGAVISQNTAIGVTGCSKSAVKQKAQGNPKSKKSKAKKGKSQKTAEKRA